jgi:hypothetical protein
MIAWRSAHLGRTLPERLAGHAAAACLRRMVAEGVSASAAMVKLGNARLFHGQARPPAADGPSLGAHRSAA